MRRLSTSERFQQSALTLTIRAADKEAPGRETYYCARTVKCHSEVLSPNPNPIGTPSERQVAK